MAKQRRTAGKSAAEHWAPLAKIIGLTYRKVTKVDVVAAEKALKLKLPRSYVELVTTVGAPAVAARSGSDAKHLENLGFAVLRPAEIVKLTRALRRAPSENEAFDADELAHAKRDVANAIWFQTQRDASDGFVWLLDTLDATGEMRCGDYAHDYLYELQWTDGAATFDSFTAVQAHVAAQILEHTRQHGTFTAL